MNSLTRAERKLLFLLRNRPDLLHKVIIEELMPRAKGEGNIGLLRLCKQIVGVNRKGAKSGGVIIRRLEKPGGE